VSCLALLVALFPVLMADIGWGPKSLSRPRSRPGQREERREEREERSSFGNWVTKRKKRVGRFMPLMFFHAIVGIADH